MKPGRNDSCPCGSGKKYKNCCEGKVSPRVRIPADAEVMPLVAMYNAGRYAEMEGHARQMTERFPAFGFGWKLLGGALHMQRKNAVFAFQKAAELMPGEHEVYFNLGVAQKGFGLLKDAAESYRRAIKLRPDYAEAHANLGNVLKELGEDEAAIASYRRALQLNPGSADTHNSLGTALKDSGQTDEAIACFQRAIQLRPGHADAHYNLGNMLKDLGRVEEATESYRRAIQHRPDFALAWNNLGMALRRLGRQDEAIASFQRVIEFNPGFAEAHNNLGVLYKDTGLPETAVSQLSRAVALKPDYAEAYNNLGNILDSLGRPEEAIANYRRALEIAPDFSEAHSNLLFCLHHYAGISPQDLYAEHLRFARHFEEPLRAGWPVHRNSRDPDRPLKVGFVSADLRNNAVSHFFEPVAQQLARDPGFQLHVYYNNTIEDHVTRRLKAHLPRWNVIAGLADESVAHRIIEDEIDILYDLSGHTGKNRLLVFARKPAPVQVSWIGYPGTTGLSAMDYYQSDHFLLPEGIESQFSEKLVRLPASVPFLPSPGDVPVNALPALDNGYLTFGSFNRPSKISRGVVTLWAKLLHALPDARLLLGGMPLDGQYQALVDWFREEGIAPERLEFHPHSNMERYLALHHRVDICLDTFPYNGGTTTFHALWMGVPTLTLAGDTAAARSGISVLGHVGLDSEFAAFDESGFVDKGLYWREHLAGLSEIRAGLRGRLANSTGGRPEVVAENMGRALRLMWRHWCAGLDPVSITIP